MLLRNRYAKHAVTSVSAVVTRPVGRLSQQCTACSIPAEKEKGPSVCMQRYSRLSFHNRVGNAFLLSAFSVIHGSGNL
jgi:protein gp37